MQINIPSLSELAAFLFDWDGKLERERLYVEVRYIHYRAFPSLSVGMGLVFQFQ